MPDAERFTRLVAVLNDVERRTKARIGEVDVHRVKRLEVFSRTTGAVGRVLIAVSPKPPHGRSMSVATPSVNAKFKCRIPG